MKYLIVTLILFSFSISFNENDAELIDSVKKAIEKYEFEQVGTPNISRARYGQFGQSSLYKLDKSLSYKKDEVKLDLFVYEFNDSKQATDAYNSMQSYKYASDILKENNLLLKGDNTMLLIKVGCNYSKSNWETLVAEIFIDRAFNCPCGGKCVDL